jgi:predicted aconitase
MNVVGVDRSRDLKLPDDWVIPRCALKRPMRKWAARHFQLRSLLLRLSSPFGESVAWAESSAVVFINSVLGARDNREGGPSALAAGLCGRTPHHGFHLSENRKGDILFKVTAKPQNIADYGALGSYVGKMVGEKIPVFENLGHPSLEQLVYFGSALASSGGVALYHAVGLTPEAPTVEAVLGGANTKWLSLARRRCRRVTRTSPRQKETARWTMSPSVVRTAR